MARIGRAALQMPAGMNKTEARYAQHLELRKRIGEVHAYWFEPLKLRIGKACFYTPDFLVQLPDGSLELHEVKGSKSVGGRPSFYATEDSKIKIRAVMDKFPFRLVVCYQRPGRLGGGWIAEEL